MRGIAAGIAAAAVTLAAASLVLAFVDRGSVPASQSTWDVAEISQMLVAAVTSVVGFVIASRRPENPIGWLAQAAIALRAQRETLTFTVSDDGAGFDAQHTPLGAGLRNMADRLAALGVRLEVTSAPGQGTTIAGQLPFS